MNATQSIIRSWNICTFGFFGLLFPPVMLSRNSFFRCRVLSVDYSDVHPIKWWRMALMLWRRMKRRNVEMLTLMRRQWLSHRHDFSGPCPLRDWTLLSRSVARLTTSPTRCRSTLASLSSRLGPEPSAVGYNDYEAERRTFKLDQPQFYNFASDVIDRWAHTEQVRYDVITLRVVLVNKYQA